MFLIVKPYIFNVEKTFSSRIFKKIFSFKMFPKYSLDLQNIATLRKNSASIPGVLDIVWEEAITLFQSYIQDIKDSK